MLLLTAAEMRAVDAATIRAGTSGVTLMERAGRGVAEALERRWGSPLAMRVLVLAGGGNNGGDGLVVARVLAGRGARVAVALCASGVRGDASTMRDRLEGTSAESRVIGTAAELRAWVGQLDRWDFALDALLGTGAEGDPRGLIAEGCRLLGELRAQGSRIIAVDLPTGVSGDDGSAWEHAVPADLTVTFGHARRGHYLYPGRERRGELEVVDIGLVAPSSAGLQPAALSNAAGLAPLVPVRDPRAHKGSTGRALIVGGAPGMTGAMVLAARAAQRAGAGYVRLAAPASLADVLASHLVEAMVVPCGESEQRSLTTTARARIEAEAAAAHAVALGCGLSLHPHAATLARELAAHLAKPLVLDADALHALSPADGVLVPALRLAPAPRVLTPHLGEMQRLTGQSPAELEARRIDATRGWAQRWGAVVLLKGAPTVIAAPDGRVCVNPTGSAALATAGTGDVLTGILVALLAQGLTPYDAARLAAFVHGLAADHATSSAGPTGLIASDLPDHLPAAFRSLRHAR